MCFLRHLSAAEAMDTLEAALPFQNQIALGLDYQDVYKLARNAFRASFLSPSQKKKYLDELDQFVAGFGVQ